MRVLKTINNVGQVKRDSYVPPINSESTQHQRRGAKTLEKVNEINIFMNFIFITR